MESSIAVFLLRRPACERPPTEVPTLQRSQVMTLPNLNQPCVDNFARQNTRLVLQLDCSRVLGQQSASQRSLHNASIFRLLLKVAVNGTHQCDFLNF